MTRKLKLLDVFYDSLYITYDASKDKILLETSKYEVECSRDFKILIRGNAHNLLQYISFRKVLFANKKAVLTIEPIHNKASIKVYYDPSVKKVKTIVITRKTRK